MGQEEVKAKEIIEKALQPLTCKDRIFFKILCVVNDGFFIHLKRWIKHKIKIIFRLRG